MKFDFKKFMWINLGIVIMTIGLYYFLMPSKLAVGGATGAAMVLSYIIPVPMGIILGILNIILFITAFLILGKEFGGYTVYASLALSGMIAILEIITPMSKPFTDDLFINLIFLALKKKKCY